MERRVVVSQIAGIRAGRDTIIFSLFDCDCGIQIEEL